MPSRKCSNKLNFQSVKVASPGVGSIIYPQDWPDGGHKNPRKERQAKQGGEKSRHLREWKVGKKGGPPTDYVVALRGAVVINWAQL